MKHVLLFDADSVFQTLKDKLESPFLCLIKNTQKMYFSKTEKEYVAEIGDIVVYSSAEDRHIFIHPSDFNGDEGQPIAIVTIPSKFSKSGKNVCISLANMDASNAKEGFTGIPYPGPVPEVTGTYTNNKGVVTENVAVKCTDGYQTFQMEGWNGRVTTSPTYNTKRIIDFDNKLIGDEVINRYDVTNQFRWKFTPCRASAVTRKFQKFPFNGNSTQLVPGPSGSDTNVKGYVPQFFYNPKYIMASGDHYTDGFKDTVYPSHYWYNKCTEDNLNYLRVQSPIKSDGSFNETWDTTDTLTSDFDGKRNTEELVADALEGVYDVEGGNLIKWDGTAEALWKPYEVSKYTTVCKTGYNSDGTAYTENNYNKLTEEQKADVKLYMFPSNYNNSGALMSFWNYAALTCHCFAPAGSGTTPGDWYCPASGEVAFALAFAKEINDSIDLLKTKGFDAVGLNRPVSYANGTETFCNAYANNPYFIPNEYMAQILLTSSAYDDTDMVDMYTGHASFYARHANQSSKTRAFIQI